MKMYRGTPTYFDQESFKIDQFGNKHEVKDGLREARLRLAFFEREFEDPDEEIQHIIAVTKDAIADMEGQR